MSHAHACTTKRKYEHFGESEERHAGRGAIEIATVPADFPLVLQDNMAAHDTGFRGMIRAVDIGGMPGERGPLTSGYVVPAVREVIPRVTMLAHRYAKTNASAPLLSDPVGRLVSIEDATSASTPDERHYVFHYEKVDIDYTMFKTALIGAGMPPEGAIPEDRAEWIRLDDKGGPRDAGCAHFLESTPTENICWVHPELGTWEKRWGTDW